MWFRSLVIVFILNFLFLFALNTNSAESKELKIGLVDLSKAFESYNKRKHFDKQLKELERHYEKSLHEKKSALEELGEEIEFLDMGTESRLKKEETFHEKKIDLEVFAKFAEQNLLNKYKVYFEDIYLDVTKETAKFGKKNGYDLIIKNEEPELRSHDISDLQFKIGIKAVLYYSDAVDITPSIIKNINEQFALKSKK